MDLDHEQIIQNSKVYTHGLHVELKQVSFDINELSKKMLQMDITAHNATGLIDSIVEHESLTATIQDKLIEEHDMLHELIATRVLNAGHHQDVILLLEDIDNLKAKTVFLSDRINFLMGAVMDFINIKQNKIIQVFSVASVCLLPPTLVASIYGMNIHIPELILLGGGGYAYIWALICMILSAGIPMYIFHRKGWLK